MFSPGAEAQKPNVVTVCPGWMVAPQDGGATL
jgi:hypothetical protein